MGHSFRKMGAHLIDVYGSFCGRCATTIKFCQEPLRRFNLLPILNGDYCVSPTTVPCQINRLSWGDFAQNLSVVA